jgi:hypothetical protein
MCPLTFCRKKGIYDAPVYGSVWQATTSVMNKEGRDECHTKNLQQKHSLNGSGWTKQHIISNLEDIIALSPKLELGCRSGAGHNSPHFSQPKNYSHYSWRHHLARRWRGQEWHDSIHPCVNQSPIKGWLLTKPWKTMTMVARLCS